MSYNYNTSRIICQDCGRHVIPRIYFSNGMPYKSYCPFCGGMIEQFYNHKGLSQFLIVIVMSMCVLYILAVIAEVYSSSEARSEKHAQIIRTVKPNVAKTHGQQVKNAGNLAKLKQANDDTVFENDHDIGVILFQQSPGDVTFDDPDKS